jgi:glycosyltransferase involved in cell wall biosynthesis
MAQVSIIIPTYNRVSTLLPAIESAREAGPDVEIIVVDNGSTDQTAEVCGNMAGIRYTRLFPNVRQARARNAGIKLSSSEYLVFLDDDDLRLPGSLPPQIELMKQNPEFAFVYAPILLGDPINCEPTGEVRPADCPAGDLFWKLLEGNFILFHSVLMRRTLVEDVGLLDPEVVGAEDWALLIRLAERGPVGVTENPVGIYRMYTPASGQTSSRRAQMYAAAAKAQAKALGLPRAMAVPKQCSAVRSQFLKRFSAALVDEAFAAMADGRYRWALEDYVVALRLDPIGALHPYNLKRLLTLTGVLRKPSDARP